MKGINIKKVLSFSFVIMFSCIFSYGKDEIIKSQWASSPPKIDGLDQDWTAMNLYSQKNNIKLGLRNDEKYLYILFCFTNPKYLSTVELTGLTVYFNPEGKKDKDFGLNFRKIKISADEFIARLEKERGPLKEE